MASQQRQKRVKGINWQEHGKLERVKKGQDLGVRMDRKGQASDGG